MKRFRLSTLLLLVVIAAMGFALLEQGRRARRREAEFRAEIARLASEHRAKIARLERADFEREWKELANHRIRQAGLIPQPGDPNVGNPSGR